MTDLVFREIPVLSSRWKYGQGFKSLIIVQAPLTVRGEGITDHILHSDSHLDAQMVDGPPDPVRGEAVTADGGCCTSLTADKHNYPDLNSSP